MIMKDDNDYIKLSRLRSVRRRKRMQKEDFDKHLLRLSREERAVWGQMRSLGWTELKPPVQRGFMRYYILRDDVRRTKQADFYQKILDKINTRQYSSRRDFKKKKKKFGKKIYTVREQNLRDIPECEFLSNKFSDIERFYFYETTIHVQWSKRPMKVFRFTEQWRFVLRIQPDMITKVRVKDLDLERRSKEIQDYFSFSNRRHRLWKLLHGCERWKWESLPKEKYKDPFHNRAFVDVLNEYYPDPELLLKISYKNPRQSRGFSFKAQTVVKVFTALEFFLSFHVSPEVLTSRINYEARHKGFGRCCGFWL